MATPEISTSNGGPPRRMACKLCRDRKVRCGGEQPACEKCRRAGEGCVYLPTQKPSKADLAQTVETLKKRLVEAEAIITRMRASSEGAAHTSPSSYDLGTPAGTNSRDTQSRIKDISCGVHGGVVSDSVNAENNSEFSSHEHGMEASKPVSRGPYLPAFQDQVVGRENELPLCSMDEYMNIDFFNASIYPQGALVSQRGVDEDTGTAILDPVTRFTSAIFRGQAETLVMASVVADYIAWLRKAPPGGGIPNVSESPVYLGMLDNLEVRLRELCEMSQSSSAAALQELVADLGAIAPPGGPMAARLGSLEEDMQREARDRAEVFRSRYNPCALLADQARNTSE